MMMMTTRLLNHRLNLSHVLDVTDVSVLVDVVVHALHHQGSGTLARVGPRAIARSEMNS